jgi:hypothetical protein
VLETVAVHEAEPVYDIDDGEQLKVVVVPVWMMRVVGVLTLEP